MTALKATLSENSTAEAEIRAQIAAWSKSLEAKDVDGLAANCASDIVLFDLKPPFTQRGVKAYRANWEACLPYFPDRLKSERKDISISIDGDTAFMHCLHRISTPDATFEGMGWVRVTVCYRREGQKWVATHEHVSVPVDPASGKAAFETDPDTL